jgi:ABC-type polysaccharide/polyol phosphate export permease
MLNLLKDIYKRRELLSILIVRNLKIRYKNSVLGFFWSFINPLLLLLIYSFVFTVVLPNRSPDTQPYALFLFCGILPWTWFSSSLLESSNVLIGGGSLIKKVLFPAEVLPIVTVLANMVHFLLGLPILGLFLLYYQHASISTVEAVCFPLVILVQLLLTLGLALILSALTVHFRDIKDILSNIITFWFFATPIIYRIQDMPATRRWLFNLNPFTHLAISYQEILFFEGPFGHWKWLLALGVASIALFLFGYFVFDRLRDSFAEEV